MPAYGCSQSLQTTRTSGRSSVQEECQNCGLNAGWAVCISLPEKVTGGGVIRAKNWHVEGTKVAGHQAHLWGIRECPPGASFPWSALRRGNGRKKVSCPRTYGGRIGLFQACLALLGEKNLGVLICAAPVHENALFELIGRQNGKDINAGATDFVSGVRYSAPRAGSRNTCAKRGGLASNKRGPLEEILRRGL